MKKTIIAAIALIGLATSAMAQRNSFLLYGNVEGGRTASNNTVSNRYFDLDLGAGYQFDNNWTLGINLATETWGNGVAANDYSATMAGPFIRYATPLSPLFSVYGQAGLSFGRGGTSAATSNMTSVNFFPALFLNIKKGFGLNFTIGGLDYTSSKANVTNAVPVNSWSYGFGNTFGIGISKNFVSTSSN